MFRTPGTCPRSWKGSGGGARYTWGVPVIGRGRELREIGLLLDRAGGGAGGLLIFVGASGLG